VETNTFKKSLNINLKVRMIKTLQWSMLLYGSETWTLRKDGIKRLKACECGFGEEF